ncbi:MAG: carbohydrate ABC transporter permease, partial [Sphaerochaeta sp.]|nr:carbohydrate ABC transporter permease [Sphaerochaeta sp.]
KAIYGNNNNPVFLRNIWNSLVVALTDAATTVLLASLCGYGLAKFKFKGRTFVFMAIMATMMIPFEAIMIPLYMVASSMKIMDTYRGLIIPFLVSAFGVFQMRQYLITFPSEYLDASRVDGLGEFSIYWRIVLPNCTPVVATLGILSFRNQWDNLLWPLLVSQSEKMKTIPLYITKFSEEKQTDEGAMMACALLASIPMFLLFGFLSKYFLGGAEVYESRKG